MNARILSLLLCFFLSAVAVRAEFNVESIVTKAKADTKNAPAIVAAAAVENPNFVIQLVSAAVTALPNQAVEIVRAVLAALPKRAIEVVRAAIIAQPKLAADIASAAAAALPDQSPAIIAAAVEVAPDDLKGAIAAPTTSGALGGTTGTRTAPPSFPAQPIRPDLVSPSS